MGFGLRARKRMGGKEISIAIRKALGCKSVVLIGLMGAGKTAIGRRLAKRLNLDFTDADGEIEQAAGQSITDIFSEHGEAYFRDGEQRVIARLLNDGPQVLATGGGAYMSEETRGNIASQGISVWLKAELDVLLERTGRRDNRPLLKAGDPRAVLERLIEERYPVYANADITVQSRDVAHEVIVDEILTALNQKMVSAKNGKRRRS
jgi:shikimate kinase